MRVITAEPPYHAIPYGDGGCKPKVKKMTLPSISALALCRMSATLSSTSATVLCLWMKASGLAVEGVSVGPGATEDTVSMSGTVADDAL